MVFRISIKSREKKQICIPGTASCISKLRISCCLRVSAISSRASCSCCAARRSARRSDCWRAATWRNPMEIPWKNGGRFMMFHGFPLEIHESWELGGKTCKNGDPTWSNQLIEWTIIKLMGWFVMFYLSHVLNSKCLTSWHQIKKCLPVRHCLRLTCTQVLLTRISCLTRSLRWLTRTTVLLTPQPYKGPLAWHEHKGLEREQVVGHVVSLHTSAKCCQLLSAPCRSMVLEYLSTALIITQM